ncbi:family A1 protease [Suillus spraguei]|nr:family A1 protease [Suillus spraguei]
MFSAASSLTLLALSITGSPVEVRNSRITLPMARRLKFSNGTKLVQQDEARLAAFKDYSTNGRCAHLPLANDYLNYIVSVGIGDPPQSVNNLIVDTGSANTWVGASTRYTPTRTSFNTRQPVGQTYGSASFTGMLWTDTITFADGLALTRMPIGVASTSWGIIGADGILGIGPASMTLGSLRNSPEEPIQTVTDLLYSRGIISHPLVGLFFQPSTTDADDDGELSFGETNPAMYIRNIAYTPTTATGPSARYWGINQSITYGSKEILSLTAGIVDCGSTFLWIASDAYDSYQTATGADWDPATSLLTITLDQYGALQNLDFHIDHNTYSLTRNAQIWPRSLNYKIYGDDGAIYLVVKRSSSGLDFVNGYVFLQRFYNVLDTSSSLVGFATTLFTDATTN